MIKFFLLDEHLCFASTPRKTSQYLIKTDFSEEIMYFKTNGQQLSGRNWDAICTISNMKSGVMTTFLNFRTKKSEKTALVRH